MSPSRPSPDASFAANIRFAREAEGLSQEAMAARMLERGHKFHQTTVNKVEKNERRVSVGEAVDLAAIVKVPVSVLASPTREELQWNIVAVQREALAIVEWARSVSPTLRQLIQSQPALADALKDANAELARNKRYTPAQVQHISDALQSLAAFSTWETPSRFLSEFETLRTGLEHDLPRFSPVSYDRQQESDLPVFP